MSDTSCGHLERHDDWCSRCFREITQAGRSSTATCFGCNAVDELISAGLPLCAACDAYNPRPLKPLYDKAALWDAVGEPALALLRELLQAYDMADATSREVYELAPTIRALLKRAEPSA